MKINFMNLLRGGIFLFAIVAAFAFRQPAQNQKFVPILDGSGEIVGGTPVEPGYTCDTATQEMCTAEFENDVPLEENLIEESVEFGEYQAPE